MSAGAIAPGSSFEVLLDPVLLPDIVRYAGASGDFNPSHYDAEVAVAAGFKTNFAQGMLTAGLLGVVVAERLGPGALRGFGVRFVAPLFCGDQPKVQGRVVSVEDGRARLDLVVVAGGAPVLTGWAEIAVESPETASGRV